VKPYEELDLRPRTHREAPATGFAELHAVLSSVLGDDVEILERRPNPHSSTFIAEVVSCRAGGDALEVLCKRGPAEYESGHGHRGGLIYEASVYESVVEPSGLPAPRFFGAHVDEEGLAWLLVEWITGGVRVDYDPPAMVPAAAWAGLFHRTNAGAESAAPFLKRYGVEYFLAWPPRALAFTQDLDVPWLGALADRYAELVPLLVDGPQTIVHAEYTVHNVVARLPEVYPIDWQSAAVSAGEIDVAALTEAWDPETVAACERAYAAARWPDGAPAEFAERLLAARLYLHFRWLGDRELMRKPRKRPWRMEELRGTAEALGVL
jgi:Phosphotransferase enzyme family